MKRKEARLVELFDRYVRRTATGSEESELMGLLIDPELADAKATLLDQTYDRVPDYAMGDSQADGVFDSILNQPVAARPAALMVRGAFKRWIAAASILLLLGVGTYFSLVGPALFSGVVQVGKDAHPDILAPSTNRAMIKLSNGQTVYLDSAANGKLFQQNGVAIVKLADGKIAYSGSSPEVLYNTLINPNGSKVIDMVLSDGSHVWLNAGSSLTFPLAFVGSERKVAITGEAYFEVAKHAELPFRVTVEDNYVVEVLGTHFNINSFRDQSTVNTTLLEGSIKVTGPGAPASLTIVPGQQAQINEYSDVILNARPNLEQVMAWKNGYFHFENADLQTVMRQISRWYDVEVIYAGEVPKRRFAGEMQLDLSLSQMLRILEKNNVHFDIQEGKKLLVSD